MSEQIRQKVIEALIATAERPVQDDVNLRPIEDMGFDSQDGVAIACELSELLGFEIPDEVNPLVNDKEKRGRTIGEIVDLLETLRESKEL